MLTLVWHRFWIDDDSGWTALLAAFPAVIAYSPSVGRTLLDLAGRLIPSTAHDEQRRLRLLRATVGPTIALTDQAGAESLSELDREIRRSSIEPDTGCEGERQAILEWLNGQRALHNGDLHAALQHLTAAADLSPEPAHRLRRWISRSLLSLSQRFPSQSPSARPDPDRAPYAAAASLAVELEPANPEAQRRWGTVLHHLGRNEEALSAFDAAIELDHLSADAHVDRGEILRTMHRYDEALDAVNQAIGLRADDTRAVASRGDTYRQLQRYEDALNDLNGVIEGNYEKPWVFVSRGLVYLAQGNHEKALADFGKAIDLNAEYSIAFRVRGWAQISGKGASDLR